MIHEVVQVSNMNGRHHSGDQQTPLELSQTTGGKFAGICPCGGVEGDGGRHVCGPAFSMTKVAVTPVTTLAYDGYFGVLRDLGIKGVKDHFRLDK